MFKSLKPQTIYLYLVSSNTLATSFIWGINTIFLLNAGLSNFQAFAANAFFTGGSVLFDIPTGVVADKWGRKISYLLGCLTLAVGTMLYLLIWYIHGAFWEWAAASLLLGLGFTFFTGAVEAWLVDALHFTSSSNLLESVLAKGQIASGAAMLVGAVAGGFIAQHTSLAVPYILRSAVLVVAFIFALLIMKDIGFAPKKDQHLLKHAFLIFKGSINSGLKNPPVRWLMLAEPFISGVSFYVFYALQPFLLKLYGNEKAYGIAGLVAALVALSQILGGFTTRYIRKLFKKRTTALITGTALSCLMLLLVSFSHNFYLVILLIFIWGLMFAALMPIRQAYLNPLINSEERATVLSFDSFMGSVGGVAIQPILGKSADVWNYPSSYALSSVFQLLSLPFIFLAKREKASSDSSNS